MKDFVSVLRFLGFLAGAGLFLAGLGCGGVDPNKPVATIDDENVITAGDFLYHYHRALEKAPPRDKPVINTIEDARAFLDDLITGRVLEIEAETRGFGDDPLLERDIVTHRRQILFKMLREDVLTEITVTEGDVREYFVRSTHPRNVSCIVSKDEKNARKAKKALDSGRAFEDVVQEYSEDEVTRKLDGRYPEPIYYVDSPVTNAIFELKNKGDYTDVIHTNADGRYYIYRYDGNAEPEKRNYEQEKGEIRSKIESYRANNLIRERVEELRDEVEIERDDEVYDSIFTSPTAEIDEKFYNRFTTIAAVGGVPVYFDDFWDSFTYELKVLGVDMEALKRSDPDGFKETVDRVLDVYVSRAMVEVEAARRGITERDDFVREINRYRAGKLVDRVYQDVFVPTIPEPTEKEIAAYYERHKAEYAILEMMEGACIILRNRGLLEQLHSEAAKSGDFKNAADIAFKHLLDKYGVDEPGEKLPPTADELVTPFKVTKDPAYPLSGRADEPPYAGVLRKYVFDYPEGTISPVIEIGDGRYLMFRNRTHTPYREKSLEDENVAFLVKRDARAAVMLSPETDRRCQEWFENLKAKHKIEVNEGVLRALFKEIQKEKR